ncbi:MAG: formylglycine-generating enzyme family protein [Acidobacteria bacterium]|nr:formylglycine-generating enzyme family protein [Acidobacteriota bacterium]
MKIKELKVSGKTKRFFAGSLLLLCAFLACKSSSATTDGDGLASLLSDKSYAQIPLGNFLMGLPDNMPGVKLEERERPQHRVLISQAFEMGKHEVTQLQWEAVMGSNPSAFKGRELPVMNISWNDVQDFLKALQAHDNRHTYRLPTEAEWEYAARAGSTGNFYGEDFLPEKKEEPKKKNKKQKKEPVASTINTALNKGNVEDPEKTLRDIAWFGGTALNRPHAVGKLKPNAWGIYDIQGNVWEWCQDWYDEKYYKDSPAKDPQGPLKGTTKVTRGCSWQAPAYLCRVTVRGYDLPNERNTLTGFRLVRVKKGAEMK